MPRAFRSSSFTPNLQFEIANLPTNEGCAAGSRRSAALPVCGTRDWAAGVRHGLAASA